MMKIVIIAQKNEKADFVTLIMIMSKKSVCLRNER